MKVILPVIDSCLLFLPASPFFFLQSHRYDKMTILPLFLSCVKPRILLCTSSPPLLLCHMISTA